ncbi:hypothetical protein BH582_24340 [Vibrio sp. 10N.222.47.A9]|uniref:hypothetical protein n=1 Tax=Vibrio sp. 10N.222.47.A9 TaxID=1903178 RepID=UPI0009775101|nr:hypothetical protein [Vibrio sp. 10N.222.47.A9]OMO22915.1 hypothetical protein BH582_24340 [Vibrio sp. 10N.222.47.A9]
MSDVRGLVTYFNFDHFGFYRIRQGKVGELHSGTIEQIFGDLQAWLSGKHLKDTLVFDAESSSRRNRVYCRSFAKNDETGDIVITLWKAVGSKNGGVGGAFADESLSAGSKQTLTTGTEVDGKEIIWGQPSYYWVIPEHNKLASIRLTNSSVDTSAFCQYIKSYVDFRRTDPAKKVTDRTFVHPKTNTEVKSKTVTYKVEIKGENEGQSETCSLSFKSIARQFKKGTSSVDIETICEDVTHIVYRESFEKTVPDTRSDWMKLYDKLGDLFDLDTGSPSTSETTNIELVVEAKPTVEALQAMMDDYTMNYDGKEEWCNVGLKRDGRTGRTTWLDEFVVTDEIQLPINNNDYYESSEVLSVINTHRQRLLSSLKTPKPVQEPEPNESLVAANG